MTIEGKKMWGCEETLQQQISRNRSRNRFPGCKVNRLDSRKEEIDDLLKYWPEPGPMVFRHPDKGIENEPFSTKEPLNRYTLGVLNRVRNDLLAIHDDPEIANAELKKWWERKKVDING